MNGKRLLLASAVAAVGAVVVKGITDMFDEYSAVELKKAVNDVKEASGRVIKETKNFINDRIDEFNEQYANECAKECTNECKCAKDKCKCSKESEVEDLNDDTDEDNDFYDEEDDFYEDDEDDDDDDDDEDDEDYDEDYEDDDYYKEVKQDNNSEDNDLGLNPSDFD